MSKLTMFSVPVHVTVPWFGPPLIDDTATTLCTSGFVDDVTFSRNGAYGIRDCAHADERSLWFIPKCTGAKSAIVDCLAFIVWSSS